MSEKQPRGTRREARGVAKIPSPVADFRVAADLPPGKRLAVSKRLFAVFGPELEAAFFRTGVR